MDQTGNVLGSWRIVWHTIIPSRFTTFQCRLCVVHSRSLERHSPWYDLCIRTKATTTHISCQSCHQLEGCVRLLSAYSWHYTFRNLVRSWSSSSKTTFSFLYQRLAGAELHRWETYLEHRVQAKGWDGPTLRRTLRHLPRSVPQPHRWFLLLKVQLNAPIASARLGCSASR